MAEKINSNQPLKAYGLGAGLKNRLAMMANAKAAGKPKDVLKAASAIAEDSVRTEDKAEEKSKPSTAYESGVRLRELLVRTGAIVTDPTGKTAEVIAGNIQKDQETIDEKRRKEDYEKYGGSPTLPEKILHGIGDLADLKDVELTRRDLLVGKLKKGMKAIAREVGPDLLPFPFNRIARFLGVFRWK